MISVSNLSKIFRTEEIETTALNGVSFEIKDGEFVAIMGPSGCGPRCLTSSACWTIRPAAAMNFSAPKSVA